MLNDCEHPKPLSDEIDESISHAHLYANTERSCKSERPTTDPQERRRPMKDQRRGATCHSDQTRSLITWSQSRSSVAVAADRRKPQTTGVRATVAVTALDTVPTVRPSM